MSPCSTFQPRGRNRTTLPSGDSYFSSLAAPPPSSFLRSSSFSFAGSLPRSDAGAPHSAQNLAPAASFLPHFVHRSETGWGFGAGAPQSPQNLAPGASFALHFAQTSSAIGFGLGFG